MCKPAHAWRGDDRGSPRPDLHRASGCRAPEADPGVLVTSLDDDGAGEGDGREHRAASDSFWSIDDRVRKNLARALYSLDKATIGTIHGFFARVLNEHAFAGGRLFDGTLEDGRTLFGHAFKTAASVINSARDGSQAAPLLALWLDQNSKGIDELEKQLYKLHATRREIRPGDSTRKLCGARSKRVR